MTNNKQASDDTLEKIKFRDNPSIAELKQGLQVQVACECK